MPRWRFRGKERAEDGDVTTCNYEVLMEPVRVGYTHRIALSNHRIVALEGRCVTFQWRDRADGNKTKLLKLDVVDFLRRFLLHVMPSRFMRIRHYGFLANSVRKKGIDLCRKLLHVDAPPHDSSAERPGAETWQEFLRRLT